jgi:hypothetical protein
VAVAITHVPSDERRRGIVAMQRRVWPGARVVPDVDRRGCWPTVRRAWKLIDELGGEATHGLVLADDMLPSRDAAGHVEEIARLAGERPVTMFTMDREMVFSARENGRHWCTTFDGAWGGSMLIPRAWIREWLEWDALVFVPEYQHDDARLASYVYTHDRGPWWHAVPPLFQHACAMSSVMGQNNSRRVSSVWSPEVGEVDWRMDDPWPGTTGRTRMVKMEKQLTPAGVAWFAEHGKRP